MYHALILIDSSVTPQLDKYHAALVDFYAEDGEQAPSITLEDDTIIVSFTAASPFTFKIVLNDDDYVQEESQEMANDAAKDHPDHAIIATAKARLEIASDNDENMDYFNDFIYLLEQADAISDKPESVYPYDSMSAEFLV